MANTYTQIYIQIVFAVFARQCLIPRAHKEELFKYITGVVKKRKQKVIAINGVADHIHLFVGMTPEIAVSDLVRDVKASSSGFFNDKPGQMGDFLGRKVLELFLIHARRLIRLLNTFSTRKNTIDERRFGRNICHS